MENDKTVLNGKKTAVLEKAADSQVVESAKTPTIQIALPELEEKDRVPAKQKSRKSKTLILGLLGVGALASSIFGYRYWQHASTDQSTDNATVTGHIYQVSTKIPGTVEQVLVSDNQLVKKGQLLVKLDPRDYQTKQLLAQAAIETARRQAQTAQVNIGLASQNAQAQNAQAQGNVNSAIAFIASAQAGVKEANAGIPAAQAQVAQAQANLQRAQADYNRYQALFKQGAIAGQQLDTAKATYEVAKAQVTSAQQGVAQAQAKLAQAQEGVTRAQAQLAESKGKLQQATATAVQTEVNKSQYQAAKSAITQSEASLKDAQLQLSYINITAPSSGRIGRKSVEVGQRVQPGTPLMSVVGNEYWIVANFKETQLEKMQPKEAVEIKLDAFPHHTFLGRVDSIAPASGAQFALLPPDNATGNFTKIVQRVPVKIILDAQSIKGYESRITPGMSAEVEVTTN